MSHEFTTSAPISTSFYRGHYRKLKLLLSLFLVLSSQAFSGGSPFLTSKSHSKSTGQYLELKKLKKIWVSITHLFSINRRIVLVLKQCLSSKRKSGSIFNLRKRFGECRTKCGIRDSDSLIVRPECFINRQDSVGTVHFRVHRLERQLFLNEEQDQNTRCHPDG